MTQPANLASTVNYGSCWGRPNGQDLSSPSYMASGAQAIGEAIACRWSTTQGRLVDDPTYGENITDCVNDDMSPADIQRKQQALAAQAEYDERVQSAQVTLKLGADGTLTATGIITPVNNGTPFKLVLSVSQVTPTTLLIQQT